MARPEAPEPLLFGMERELEYTGHITQVMHFVPLPRKTFASADETHIRIWGQEGDIAKKTFPVNQRSMVTAMTYCPTFSALITTEVDMTLKFYTTERLEVIDTFSLQQAKKGAKGNQKIRADYKVSTLVYFPQYLWLIVGGDSGADLYKIEKSMVRRSRAVDVLEFHLKMDWLRQVTTEAVTHVVPHPAEGRVLIWGPASLHVLDMDLSPVVSCRKPHSAPVCSACIHAVSTMETSVLTGGADGHVNFWVVRTRSAEDRADVNTLGENLGQPLAEEASSMRLLHSFLGHSRAVEIVNFYHRLQRDTRQRLCISYGRDSKMKVWSLESFSLVYTLDQGFLDSRSSIFSLAPHFFAVSSTYMKQDGMGKSAPVTLVRFTAHLATPFATTNHSPVVCIAQPPVKVQVSPSAHARSPSYPRPSAHQTAAAAAIISEDMAVRLVDTNKASIIATLPPPPNSKVQVLSAFICPVWQLLVLWLSSEEIAIFFIPSGERRSTRVMTHILYRTSENTTPLLLRRFGIAEVRAELFDRDLSNEAFCSVALYCGRPLPSQDTLLSRTLGRTSATAGRDEADWFLLVGTKVGTLQVFNLREVLNDLPVWQRLLLQLPGGSWIPPAQKDGGPPEVDPIFQSQEKEHMESMEERRAPGQRPFPREAPPLQLHGRWRCHDYALEVTESVGSEIFTVDSKRTLKLWDSADMHCTFCFSLTVFQCYTPYILPEEDLVVASPGIHHPHRRQISGGGASARDAPTGANPEEGDGEATSESEGEASSSSSDAEAERILKLVGLAVGTAGGGIQLVVMGGPRSSPSQPATFASHTAHGAAMLQIDYSWAANVFVSIGRDDVVKIWSASLALLRDISFPASLTAISFRREPGVDRPGTNGDILVGFASHVEQIPYEVWSRGLRVEDLERFPGQDSEDEEPLRTRRGLLRLEANDDIDGHAAYLHSPPTNDAMRVRELLSARKGVDMIGAAYVAKFSKALLEKVQTGAGRASKREQRNPEQKQRPHDFRGKPVIEVGALSGRPADWNIVHPSTASREPVVNHERSEVLDEGDFRSLTRCYPDYYDWAVKATPVVDAPRQQAVRGEADTGKVALVTSLGIGHLRNAGTDEEAAAGAASAGHLESEEGALPAVSSETHDEEAMTGARSRGAATGPRRPFKPPKQVIKSPRMRQLEAAGELSADELKAAVGGLQPTQPPLRRGKRRRREQLKPAVPKSSDWGKAPQPPPQVGEDWRTQRVARGLPSSANEVKPRSQNVANTEGDSAHLMEERGNLHNAPELPEEDFLKSLFAKKTDWLYYPHNSRTLALRRAEIEHAVAERADTLASWTKSGRFVCPSQSPPLRAIPASAVAPQPVELVNFQQRTCMTRSEITEQRLIEAAMRGPPPVPDLSIRSEERFQQELRPPGSARASSSSARVNRLPLSSGPGKKMARARTPLPLSART